MLRAESHHGPTARRPLLTLSGARLLDWRFLLPDHELGVVACGTQCEPSLVEALQALAERVIDVADQREWQSVAAESADVLVLVRPDAHELRAALRVLRPGGSVYCEIVRNRRGGPGGLSGLRGARRALLRAGLTDVRTQWHAPNLAIRARIVPLDGAPAVRNTLRRHDGVRFGRLKSIAGHAALACGLFAWVVPEGSVTAQRPSSSTGGAR